MKNVNTIIAATTRNLTDAREGTLEAKLRIAAEQASATEKAAADKVAAEKARKAQSLADRNHNAQAAAAERKASKKAAMRAAKATRKAENKSAESKRAEARSERKPATAAPVKPATPSEVNYLGERIAELAKQREEYNRRLGDAVEASDWTAYSRWAHKRHICMVDISLLCQMLTRIGMDYKDDAAMQALIRAAKSGKAYQPKEKAEKTTRVALKRYRAAVIKPQNIFSSDVLRAINALHGLDANGKRKPLKSGECSKEYAARVKAEACRALAYLEDIFDKKIAFPVMKAEELETRTLAQSLTSDIVGINDRGLQDKLVIIDHNLWQRLNVLNAKDLFPCKLDIMTGEELDGEQRIERLAKGYIERFETEGFTVSFGNDEHHFESWCYSNSGLKKGVGMLMDSETRKTHNDAFMLGLDELPATNGQEQYKIAALFNTPSKIWERTWTDMKNKEHRMRLHVRNIIMLPAIKIHIPLTKGAVLVGKGTDVAVTVNTMSGKRDVTLPITVDPKGTVTVEVDGWDGLILVNVEGFEPCQCRLGGSMKMLAIGVHGLLEKIIAMHPEYAQFVGKDIYIEDIDHTMQLWQEGSMLTTDTTWKAKKWFRGANGEANWAKYVANLEKLAETYDGFDCLRVVNNADALDEMETNRHTSRQLMAQLLNMSASDAHLLMEGSGKKTAQLATVNGALRKLAGLGKDEDTVTQLEYLFRAKPWLVGQKQVKTAMLVKMYDELATLASANFATEETTLFMAQDVSAMMEVALLGASVDKADLGMLAAGEFSTPGMRDGKKAVLVRYPSNGLNGTVMKNREIGLFDTCGNIIMLNIHDPWIVDNDGDCDGDHAAAYTNNWLVSMFERMEDVARKLGLNKTVIFEHGDGAESRPATAEWMAKGRVEAVFNGMAFNYVGRFSNSAMFAWTMCSKAYHSGDMDLAYRWGMLANLFQVGAILTIDWCKTGVPAMGTPSRHIFDVALDLLDLQGEYAHGHAFAYKPWAQMFRDHEPGCCFVTKSKPVERMSMKGNKYLKHNYAQPSNAAIDMIAMAVMQEAGMHVDINGIVTKAKFEETPEFNILSELHIEPATIMVDGKLVAAKNAQNGIVRSRLLHQINPNRFNANTLDSIEDRDVATAIANGEPVSVVRFAQFCFRMLAELERGFASEAANAATEMAAAETKELVYKATRSMLYSMIDDTAWSYKPGIIDPETGKTNGQLDLGDITDKERKWQIVVDTILRDAFEIGHENRFAKHDENPENAARVKARYAMFALQVFAPDLLDRVEKADHVYASMRKANLDFVEVAEVAQRSDDLDNEDMFFVDETAYEMLYD